ncbi:hypothetical protein [Clostridium rectalis]|uniref:hypothetical protein n=1 Tax=Clostridium rectalis TaxID=2040295 RepID=UPI000F63A068|nr:hypothetical protein [Clostridium rectalis]
MRKFKVEVITTKEYEIKIDETKIDKEVLDNFERYFYDLDVEEDRIKSMANDYCRLRATGFDGSIEGYGFVLEDGKVPFSARFSGLEEKDITNGIDFKVIDDGTQGLEIEVEEII